MGLESAKRLADLGNDIIITGRNEAKLKSSSDTLWKSGVKVEAVHLDLYDKSQLSSFILKIEEEERKISHLVNSAGYFKTVSFLDHNEQDYDVQLDLNKAFFFISQAVAKNMKKNGGGAIFNIGSMWAHQAVKQRRRVHIQCKKRDYIH